MCVHNWKHAATYRLAHDLIVAGRLGEIRYVALDRLRTAPAGVGLGAGGRWRLGAASGGGILVDHGWHVFYLMRWLMGGHDPAAISAFMGVGQAAPVEDVADLQGRFSRRQDSLRRILSGAHRSGARSAKLYGSEAALEIDGDRVMLTARSGTSENLSEDLSPAPEADDSYHSAWFAGVAAEFERAVYQSVGRALGNDWCRASSRASRMASSPQS